jgi:hypothetical protein
MIDCNTFIQSVAAICSAIAAIFAAFVAKLAYDFQKNAVLKHSIANQIVTTLGHLYYLNSLKDQSALAMDDEKILDIPQRVSNAKDCVVVLQSMLTTKEAHEKITIVRQIVFGLTEAIILRSNRNAGDEHSKELHDAIDQLHNIYRMEIK